MWEASTAPGREGTNQAVWGCAVTARPWPPSTWRQWGGGQGVPVVCAGVGVQHLAGKATPTGFLLLEGDGRFGRGRDTTRDRKRGPMRPETTDRGPPTEADLTLMQGLLGGFNGQITGFLMGTGDPTLNNAGAGVDPFIRGVYHFL